MARWGWSPWECLWKRFLSGDVCSSLGSNSTNPSTVPRIPIATSASIAIFKTTIAFIPTASSTCIFKFLVASSFEPAITSFVLLSGISPVSLIVSYVETMYLRFSDSPQCLSKAVEFQRSFVPFLGVISMVSQVGTLQCTKSYNSQHGYSVPKDTIYGALWIRESKPYRELLTASW